MIAAAPTTSTPPLSQFPCMARERTARIFRRSWMFRRFCVSEIVQSDMSPFRHRM
jgi:hypothetical protein